MAIRQMCSHLAVLTALMLTPGVRAGSIDPDIAIESLAQAYQQAPIDERINVRVTIGDSSREESISVRMLPDGNYSMQLGEIHVWTAGDRFLAVHRLNAGTYFSAPRPEGRAQWGVLETLLPPLLTPQLALVHGLERGFAAPIGYTRNVSWKSCETDQAVHPPVVRLKGEGEGASVDLVADQHLTRILRVIVHIEERRTRIDLTFTREPPGLDAPTMGVDVAGRTLVSSVSELAPVAGDVKVGAVLPDFVIQPADGSLTGRISGPCVIAMFRNSAPQSQLWFEAAQRYSINHGAGTPVPIVVFTLGEAARNLKDILNAWSLALAPAAVQYSISPGTTIDRLAPGHAGVLVVVDAQQVIQAVAPLTSEDADAAYAKLVSQMTPAP